MKSKDNVLTIIIHGTFARDEPWWRPKEQGGGEEGLAAKLEAALESKGMGGTVWNSAVLEGMSWEDFAWTGNNRHRDRVRGARKLAHTLKRIAARKGADSQNPLTVNFVAHSHGGNVVLEALRRLGPGVQVGRTVFLGTPMLSFKPGFRLARLFFLGVFLTVIFLFAAADLYLLAAYIPNGFKFPPLGDIPGGIFLFISIGGIFLYGLLFALAAWLADVVWYPFGYAFMALMGRWRGQVYGPSTWWLKRRLGGRKVTLFTSFEDEADILLHLGAAPGKLFQEKLEEKYRKRKGGKVVLLIYRLIFHPFVDGLFFRGLETVLESIALGQPFFRVAIFNYEMAKIKDGVAYPSEVLEERKVADDLKKFAALREMEAKEVAKEAEALTPEKMLGTDMTLDERRKDKVRVRSLSDRLDAVMANIKDQIRLRHSLYYQSQEVIDQVADILVGERKG